MLGRATRGGLDVDSERASRHHARIAADHGGFGFVRPRLDERDAAERRADRGPARRSRAGTRSPSAARACSSCGEATARSEPPARCAGRCPARRPRLWHRPRPANEIVLDDPNVSRFHAELRRPRRRRRARATWARRTGPASTARSVRARRPRPRRRVGPYRLLFDGAGCSPRRPRHMRLTPATGERVRASTILAPDVPVAPPGELRRDHRRERLGQDDAAEGAGRGRRPVGGGGDRQRRAVSARRTEHRLRAAVRDRPRPADRPRGARLRGAAAAARGRGARRVDAASSG